MIDNDLLEHREKVFEAYRENIKNLEDVRQQMLELKSTVNEISLKHSELTNQSNYLKSLIMIMIANNCDPVEAKLKYNEEIAKMEGTSSSPMADTQSCNAPESKILFKTRYGLTR